MERPAIWAGRAAAASAFLVVVVLQLHTLDDPDTWWHLASGRRIAQMGEIAAVDPFSFTAAGAPWVNRQWLFDLGLFATWRLGGATAVVSLAAGLVFGAFGCVYAMARRRLPAWAAAALVLLASQAAVERFTVRPELVTFLLLAVYLLVLDRRPPVATLAGLVGLHVVWANCHALSVLGVGVLGAAWLETAARAGLRAAVPLALTTVAAALAEAATPFGVSGALFPLRLWTVIRGGEITSRSVVEHLPTVLAVLSPPAAWAVVALAALGALALVLEGRRVRLGQALVGAAALALAFLARRNVALAGFGLAPIVAAGLGPVATRLGGRRAAGIGAVVALVGIGLAGRVVDGRYYDDARLTRSTGTGVSPLLFSASAVEFLDREAPGVRVLNDDALGGWLLWRSGRPVFIDGRLQVYPAAVYAEYARVLADPSTFPAVAARRGIGAVLLYHPAPGRLELAGAIARLPGWRVGFIDAGAVVLLADGRPPGVPDGATAPLPPVPWRAVRYPMEEALMHYQRGRALLSLFGEQARGWARADFTAALRLWPDLDAAAVGLRVVGRGN